MLEKTARIVEKKAEFDTFGIYDKENRPRAQSGALLAGGNVERLKQQVSFSSFIELSYVRRLLIILLLRMKRRITD